MRESILPGSELSVCVCTTGGASRYTGVVLGVTTAKRTRLELTMVAPEGVSVDTAIASVISELERISVELLTSSVTVAPIVSNSGF